MTTFPEPPHRVSADGATSADTREEQCQQLSQPSGAAVDNGAMMDYAYTNGWHLHFDRQYPLLEGCIPVIKASMAAEFSPLPLMHVLSSPECT